MKKKQLNAVHDNDLKEFLKSIEEFDRVINGEAECHFCHNTITLKNIHSVFSHENTVKYCCINENCYNKLLELKYA